MAPEGKAAWWRRNERDREAMGLPAYEPPRFADGAFVHEVVADLEDRHGCEVRFLGVNVAYPDDWQVRLDGEVAFTVGRTRTERGNTVYQVTADEFERRVEAAVG